MISLSYLDFPCFILVDGTAERVAAPVSGWRRRPDPPQAHRAPYRRRGSLARAYALTRGASVNFANIRHRPIGPHERVVRLRDFRLEQPWTLARHSQKGRPRFRGAFPALLSPTRVCCWWCSPGVSCRVHVGRGGVVAPRRRDVVGFGVILSAGCSYQARVHVFSWRRVGVHSFDAVSPPPHGERGQARRLKQLVSFMIIPVVKAVS